MDGRIGPAGDDREISPFTIRWIWGVRDLCPPRFSATPRHLDRLFLPTFFEPKSTFTPSGGEVGTADMNIGLDQV